MRIYSNRELITHEWNMRSSSIREELLLHMRRIVRDISYEGWMKPPLWLFNARAALDALRLHIEELLMSFHWGDQFHSHDFLYPPSSHNHVANLMKTWFHTLLAHMDKRSCTRARGSIYISFKSQTLKKMMLFSKEEEKHSTQCSCWPKHVLLR